MLELDSIIENKNKSKELNDIDKSLLQMHSEQTFYGAEGLFVQTDKNISKAIINVSKYLGFNAEKLSTKMFLATYEQMVEEYKNLKKNKK